MEYEKKDIIDMPEFIKGVIVGLDELKAKEVFGEKANDPNKKIIQITWENSDLNITGTDQVNWYEKGKVLPRSKLGKLITKYGQLKVGVVVSLLQNKEGFYKIVLE